MFICKFKETYNIMRKSIFKNSKSPETQNKVFTVKVKWDYDYKFPIHIDLKNSMRSSNPPIKRLFDCIIQKRSSLKKVKITWKSTSEVEIEKIPEKRLFNCIQKMQEVSKRYSFTRISKFEVLQTIA